MSWTPKDRGPWCRASGQQLYDLPPQPMPEGHFTRLRQCPACDRWLRTRTAPSGGRQVWPRHHHQRGAP